MEDVTIPGWAIWAGGILLGIAFPWLAWLTARVQDNDKAIAVNTAHDKNFNTQFIEMKVDLKQQIGEVRDDFNKRLDRFEDRVFKMLATRE